MKLSRITTDEKKIIRVNAANEADSTERVLKLKQMEKKQRKAVSGPIRDKERTKKKLIATIGKILAEDRYSELTISQIASVSKLNPKLIYLYFGGVDQIVQAYLEEQGLTTALSAKVALKILENPKEIVAEDIAFFLEKQFAELIEDSEWQGILHWALVAKNKHVKKLVDERNARIDSIAHTFKKSGDPALQRAGSADEMAVVVAGARFLSMRAKMDDSVFLGLDMTKKEDQDRIARAIDKIITAQKS